MSSPSRDSRGGRHYGAAVKTIVVAVVVAIGVLLGACGSGGTSLEGTVECGANLCNSGELCRTLSSGVDASPDPGGSRSCVEATCDVEDCAGDCPPCVLQLCPSGGSCPQCPRLFGRELSCGAQ